MLSALIFLLLGTSCAKEKPVEIIIENVEAQPTETKEVAKTNTSTNTDAEAQPTETKEVAKTKNNIVVDFKEFPKNAAGKEIWTSKIKEGYI